MQSILQDGAHASLGPSVNLVPAGSIGYGNYGAMELLHHPEQEIINRYH